MRLIPINHEISAKNNGIIASAILYENAGLKAMANNLKYQSLKNICEDNGIEIVNIHNGLALNREKYPVPDWDFSYVKEYEGEVPVKILRKMAKIEDKSKLAILSKISGIDPILLYDTGLYFIACNEYCSRRYKVFVKLYEWE